MDIRCQPSNLGQFLGILSRPSPLGADEWSTDAKDCERSTVYSYPIYVSLRHDRRWKLTSKYCGRLTGQHV